MIGAAPRSERRTAWTVRASFTCAGTAQAITGRRYPRKAGPSGPPASTRSRRRLATKDPRTRSADLTWAKQIHLHPGHPPPTERRRARSKRTNRTTASPGPPTPGTSTCMDTIAQSIPLVFIARAGVAELAHFPDLLVRSQRQPGHGMHAPRPAPAASPCCGLLPATVELPIQWPVRCSSIAERRRAAHRDNRELARLGVW